MKLYFTLIVVFLFSIGTMGQVSTKCLPDKGIKIAITTAEMQSEWDGTKEVYPHAQEVHYDPEGRVVQIKDEANDVLHQRIYKEGKLQAMVSIRKDRPNFFEDADFGSLFKNAEIVTDTGFILSHYSDGEPAVLQHSDGARQTFGYKACQEEFNTFISASGDTIQQSRFIYENGVLTKSIWTPYPIDTIGQKDQIMKYYNYKRNKHGHWISRKYKMGEYIVTEKRKLTYYD